jgi:lipoate-protein ligase A
MLIHHTLSTFKHHIKLNFAIRCYTLPPNFTISANSSLRHNNKNTTSNNEKGFDLNPADIADTLMHDPNLRDFYDRDTLKQIDNLKNPVDDYSLDPYDLSNIPIYSNNENNTILNNNEKNNPPFEGVMNTFSIPYTPNGEPQTMSTEDFIKMMAEENNVPLPSSKGPTTASSSLTTDDYLSKMINDGSVIQNITVESNFIKKQSLLTTFLEKDDVPKLTYIPKILQLRDTINTELPLIIISKFTDPRINLSIEKFIYENYPDPKNPINKFAKRLFLYKNSNCIVLGKNQNIYREINLRLASTYSIPVLRRFSGGGTVVHDLGNFNFSFICSKDDFSRTAFTSELIKSWNSSINDLSNSKDFFELDLNEKGDMVRKYDMKKVSGSAFQISKGKSLHHGTMLLNSNLKLLSKLLKLDENRKSNIIDRATDSIPSPVTNTNLSSNNFIQLCANSFVKKYGVPTNLKSKLDKLNYDNLELIRIDNIEVQILKIDDLMKLPDEVLETYNQLKSWDWIFGKTPRFKMKMSLDNDKINLTFDIDKGRVISLEYDLKDESDKRLNNLINALTQKDTVVTFSSHSINKFIADKNLQKELTWNIDQSLNYKNIGIEF